MAIQLSRLQTLDPRQVWVHEAHDFTPWLLDNADALAEVLGIDIELTAAEHPVGAFSLDLVGKDLTNGCVLMVENQLTATDHGHLGQLVTYAAGTEARTIVWMATSFREEHRQALDFLNDLGGGDARFFGVEIGVVRIGGSEPAPLFKLAAQPNDWHAQVAAVTKVTADSASGKGQFYRAFWARFLERIHTERPGWTKARKPGADNWLDMPSAFKGVGARYSLNFPKGSQLRHELYIDNGDADTNLAVLSALQREQAAIEAAFGGPLSWEPLEGRRGCRVAAYGTGDVADVEAHDAYIDWFIDTGTRMRAALEPYAGALSLPNPAVVE